ncbi:MAG TPA: dTMP kinase [Tepidisphaeraceae bacterium]|jgi:dTMP kinase|nr:dTMP kinase [Tepidisphaeraceae bacterium]
MTHLRGKFIVFDGNEGCGKSTQAHLALAEIEKAGPKTVLVRDPGTTPIGEKIREILLDPKNTEMATRCEMLLFMAARAQMMKEIIMPALKDGLVVVSDRFISSTLAYQLGGDGLSEAEILAVGKTAVHEHWPDMTIIFDLPVAVSSARTRPKFTLFPDDPVAGAEKDRIERRSLEYHEMVRQNYLRQAKNRRNKYQVVDANREVEQVHADVMRLLKSLQ